VKGKEQLLQKVHTSVLSEQVVDRLREAILNGSFVPGERLVESEVAESLGTSRTPVRESLIQLEQEGLIENRPNRGSFVKDFTAEDVREIFRLRAALEGVAWRLAVERMNEEDLQFLEGLLGKQREAIAKGDHDKLIKLDGLFHQHILKVAGGPRLLKMWSQLETQREAVLNRLYRASPDIAPAVVEWDHSRILQAFCEGDVARLMQLNDETNAAVEDRCVEAFTVNGAGPAL